MNKVSPETIIHSIFETCHQNLEQNEDLLTDLDDIDELAELYIEQFSSRISKDLYQCDDLDKLHNLLSVQMFGIRLTEKVIEQYIEEIDRHQELHIKDIFKSIPDDTQES